MDIVKEFDKEIDIFATETAKNYDIEKKYVSMVLEKLIRQICFYATSKEIESEKYRRNRFTELMEMCCDSSM